MKYIIFITIYLLTLTACGDIKKDSVKEKTSDAIEISESIKETQYIIFPIPQLGHLFGKNARIQAFDDVIAKKKSEFGPVADPVKRNWGFFIFVPTWKFDPLHSANPNADMAKGIENAFDLALRHNIAVYIMIETHEWGNRDDLWNYNNKNAPGYHPDNKYNVEWIDWEGTAHPHRYRNWGQAERMEPVMCYNSPKVVAEVTRIVNQVISPAIVSGIEKLREANKEYLFAGITVGAEPALPNYTIIDKIDPGMAAMMDQDGSPKKMLGYNALSNKGFSKENPPENIGIELAKVNRDYTVLFARLLKNAGIPREKMYTHVAAGAGTMGSPRVKFNNAPIDIAFIAEARPGWTTYPVGPLRNNFDLLYRTLKAHNEEHWASTEASPTILSGQANAVSITMKDYLDRHFNHGATLVLFNVGATDPKLSASLRSGVWGENSMKEYREFLNPGVNQH